MVFSKLPNNEKEAFFSLLDEYFASRPELLATLSSSSESNTAEAASKLVSAGLKFSASRPGPYASAASNPEVSNAVGRLAAASSSFSGAGSAVKSPASAALRSPFSSGNRSDAPKPPQTFGARNVDGDEEPASTPGSVRSLASAFQSTSSPPVPSPFGAKKNPFHAPPPSASTRPAPPVTTRPGAAQREQPEAPAGEWAEALYDFTAEQSDEISLQAGQKILVIDRSSDDWWTGEVNGRSGTFPASYAELL